MVFVHLGLWHKDGSNTGNQLGIKTKAANIIFLSIFMSREFQDDTRVLCTTNYCGCLKKNQKTFKKRSDLYPVPSLSYSRQRNEFSWSQANPK